MWNRETERTSALHLCSVSSAAYFFNCRLRDVLGDRDTSCGDSVFRVGGYTRWRFGWLLWRRPSDDVVLTNCPIEKGEMGKFSWALRRLGARPSLRNTEKIVPNGFFLTYNIHKIHFRPGLTWEAYDAPQTLSWPHCGSRQACRRAPSSGVRQWRPQTMTTKDVTCPTMSWIRRFLTCTPLVFDIVVTHVYKHFFYFSIKNAFLTFFFIFPTFFILKKR